MYQIRFLPQSRSDNHAQVRFTLSTLQDAYIRRISLQYDAAAYALPVAMAARLSCGTSPLAEIHVHLNASGVASLPFLGFGPALAGPLALRADMSTYYSVCLDAAPGTFGRDSTLSLVVQYERMRDVPVDHVPVHVPLQRFKPSANLAPSLHSEHHWANNVLLYIDDCAALRYCD